MLTAVPVTHAPPPLWPLAADSYLKSTEALYTAEELASGPFMAKEALFWRAAAEMYRDRELAEIEAERRRLYPEAAEAFYGPASPTPSATASPARRATAPRHKSDQTDKLSVWSAGAHPFSRIFRAWNIWRARRRPRLNKDMVRLNARGRL